MWPLQKRIKSPMACGIDMVTMIIDVAIAAFAFPSNKGVYDVEHKLARC